MATHDRRWLLVAFAALTGCGAAVSFDKAIGSGKYPALPGHVPIAVAAEVDDLPQPAVVLGTLRLRQTDAPSPQSKAEEALLNAAAAYGCDAIAAIREERVAPASGKPGKDDADFHWTAACVRTAKAEAVAMLVPGKRAPAAEPAAVTAAEKRRQEAASRAEKARKEAERAAAVAAEAERKAKQAAEAAERERLKQAGLASAGADADRKHKEAEEERRRREADAAERERKRKEAEDEERERRRKQAEADERARKEADLAAQERKRKEAEDKALKEAEEKADKARQEQARKQAEADAKARKKHAADAEKARKAEEERARKQAEADRKRTDAADKARRDAEDKAKREADEKARREADDKVRRDADDKARREADERARQQAEERARREADDKARKEAEDQQRQAEAARKPTKGGKGGPVDWKARFDQAAADDGEAAWIDLVVAMPDGEDADRAFERLQRAARARATAWLQTDAPKESAEIAEVAPIGDPAQLRRELAEASGATAARHFMPKEVAIGWTLRNPTRQPVVVDIRGPGTRVVRALDGGEKVGGVARVACAPQSPPLRSKLGLILEYRHSCDLSKAALSLGLVRPARRDLAIDKRAADPDASLETIAKVWAANPATRLADVHLAAIEEALRRRADDHDSVQGKVVIGDKAAAGAPQPARVELRNSSARDVHVVFDAGGVEERLMVPKRGSAEIRLNLPPGAAPELKIRAVVPRLRSIEWLYGVWSFQGVVVVVLPGPGGPVAFLIEPLVDDAQPHLWPLAVAVAGDLVTLEADAPGVAVLAMFTDKTPAACEKRCPLAMRIKLSAQDRFVPGAGRVLVVDGEVPGKTGSFQFNSDH